MRKEREKNENATKKLKVLGYTEEEMFLLYEEMRV